MQKSKQKLSPQALLDSTKLTQYVDKDVVDSMPIADTILEEIQFFNVGKYISEDDLEKEYESRGLIPCDPYSLILFNEKNPDFVKEKENATHWKDKDGKWAYAAFGYWTGSDGRFVDVYRNDDDWRGDGWFAGIRKSDLSTSDPQPSSEPLTSNLKNAIKELIPTLTINIGGTMEELITKSEVLKLL